jgi:predicted MFS family arabinose efflux permease
MARFFFEMDMEFLQANEEPGILNIVFAVGSATGAPLGGLLADSIGWRWYCNLYCFALLLLSMVVGHF